MIFHAFFKIAVAGWVALLIANPVFAAMTETLHDVTIDRGVTQKYSLLMDSASTDTTRVWILFTGYDGYAEPGLIDGKVAFIGRGILIDGRELFLCEHTAVAVIDSPSNQHQMSWNYRTTNAYLVGATKTIKDIRVQLPNAQIFLVGASNGSISVTQIAAKMKSDIAGVVVLSGVINDADALSRLNLTQPILLVHHRKDACVPVTFNPDFVKRFHPVLVDDIGVHYAGQCGPYSAHHFLGQEKAVIDLIYDWADGKPLPDHIH